MANAKNETVTVIDAPIVTRIDPETNQPVEEHATLRVAGKASPDQAAALAACRKAFTTGAAQAKAGAANKVAGAILFGRIYGPDATLPRPADADGLPINGKAAGYAALHGREETTKGDGGSATRALNAAAIAEVIGHEEAVRVGSVEALEQMWKAHRARVESNSASGQTDAQAVRAAKVSTKAAASKAAASGLTGTKAAKVVAASLDRGEAAKVEKRADKKRDDAKDAREALRTLKGNAKAAENGDPVPAVEGLLQYLGDDPAQWESRGRVLWMAMIARTEDRTQVAALAASGATVSAEWEGETMKTPATAKKARKKAAAKK